MIVTERKKNNKASFCLGKSSVNQSRWEKFYISVSDAAERGEEDGEKKVGEEKEKEQKKRKKKGEGKREGEHKEQEWIEGKEKGDRERKAFSPRITIAMKWFADLELRTG